MITISNTFPRYNLFLFSCTPSCYSVQWVRQWSCLVGRIGWCGGERFTDKQSVTGPLSQVGTEGHAYSSARDKVSHDETDKQHWWRLHTISLCSPSGLSPALIFPFLPLRTQAAFISFTQCQVFTIFIFVPRKAIRFVFLNTSAFLLQEQGHFFFFCFNEGTQAAQETAFTTYFIQTHHTPTDARKHTESSILI